MTNPISVTNNLVPGQFQIGNLVMGVWTNFAVDVPDVLGYDINNQDWQVVGSSEVRFGYDTFKPAPIHLGITVRKNRIHAGVAAITGDNRQLNFLNDQGISDLQREWRAPETLLVYNQLKPLYFCGSDGITRLFFGRPGKFQAKLHKLVDSQYYQVTAEFRRADTLAFSDIEYYTSVLPNNIVTIPGTGGNMPGWLRFIIEGPANVPIINFGGKVIQLNYNIPAGNAVEISSYPWERKVVDINGISLAAYIISSQPYLDQLLLNNSGTTAISWTATGTTSASSLKLLWRNAYQIME